jgi:hypothetical protein
MRELRGDAWSHQADASTYDGVEAFSRFIESLGRPVEVAVLNVDIATAGSVADTALGTRHARPPGLTTHHRRQHKISFVRCYSPASSSATRPGAGEARGTLRGNIQIVHNVHCVQKPGRSRHIGRTGGI